MADRLHILTTCTKRKTAEIPARLMLRNVKGRDVSARAEEWVRRVAAPACPRVEAGRLYCGDHWQIARSLAPAAARRGFEPRLWVISTGYGLVPAEAEIAPYSATFSPTHRDTVGAVPGVFAAWWQRIAEWKGPQAGAPRTITELARSDAHAALLVVASEAYLGAVRSDLEAAAKQLADPDQLVIVSAGTKRLGGLGAHLLPCDARMQAALGGARRTLNVRMARRVLEDCKPHEFGAARLARKYRRVLEAQPAVEVVRRVKGTDADVAAFVSAALACDVTASATRLLKHYRGAGRACEQWRFKRIFQQVAVGASRDRTECRNGRRASLSPPDRRAGSGGEA